MNPFRFQVISIAHHSMGAIRGVESGEFTPPNGYGEPDYEGLQALVAEAKDVVAGFDKAAVDGFDGAGGDSPLQATARRAIGSSFTQVVD